MNKGIKQEKKEMLIACVGNVGLRQVQIGLNAKDTTGKEIHRCRLPDKTRRSRVL